MSMLMLVSFRELRSWYDTLSPRYKTFTDDKQDIFVDNVHMELSLWDTAGQEEFDRLRALSYEDTHVIMLCFSVRPFLSKTFAPLERARLIFLQVDNRDSFENVASKWMAEIHENCPGVKLVLTALKCDLRKDDEQNENPNAVAFDEGLAKAKEVGAVKYLGLSFSYFHTKVS